MTKNHSNKQTCVVIIQKPDGQRWTVGTDSQRGFTERGALEARDRIRNYLPHGWTCWWEELTPMDFVIESCRNLGHGPEVS